MENLAKKATLCGIVGGSLIVLTGCMAGTTLPAHILRADPKSAKGVDVAQGPDIPLVPVPPPPLYTGQGKTADVPPDDKTKPVPTAPTTPPTPSGLPALPEPTVPNPVSPTPSGLPTLPEPTVPNLVSPSPSTNPGEPIDHKAFVQQIHQQAMETYAKIDSYICRMTRREEVKGETEPEEVILFKFRKQPWTIYFKWLSENGKGREVVFSKERYEGKIHTLLAAGDIPLVPAGRRMALSPDSILVRSASRHPATEAGIGACLDRIGRNLEGFRRGDARFGEFSYRGLEKSPHFPDGLQMIEHRLPPGLEAELPRGGRRLIGFNQQTRLPALIQTYDDRGVEVEYYRYDRVQYPVGLDEADFDPDRLWPHTRKKTP